MSLFAHTQGVESATDCARQTLSALLRGEQEHWRGMDQCDSRVFLRACDYHGVGPLLWPAAVLHAVIAILLGRTWLLRRRTGGGDRGAPK